MNEEEARGSTHRPSSPSFSAETKNNNVAHVAYLSAFRVLLSDRGGGQGKNLHHCNRWLSSTKELRLVCFSLCNTCRSTLPVRVWVGPNTPWSLWAAPCEQQDGGNGGGVLKPGDLDRRAPLSRPSPPTSRRRILLGVHATTVVWDRQMVDVPLAAKLLEKVVNLKFGFHFDEPLALGGKASFPWPEALVALDLGVKFQQDLSTVPLPAGVRKLRLGGAFNRCIRNIAWPASLEQLTFGYRFNKPIDGVRWPATLKQLTFGDKFDQPLPFVQNASEGGGLVAWPPNLESLTFGADFSHNVGGGGFGGGSHLPTSLRRLTLSEGFHQHMDAVVWPLRLEELNLDCVYVGDVGRGRSEAACLPKGLKRLRLDLNFHQPVQDVVPLLPVTLQELQFGDQFNQPLDGVTWPRLTKLAFGGSFNQSIENGRASFPPELKTLTFGSSFNQSIVSVVWPPALHELAFSDRFNQPISAVSWPEELRVLQFGRAFDKPFSSGRQIVHWPSKLSRLRVGKNFKQPVEGFVLPAGLVELEFAEGCQQKLEGVAWPKGLKMITVGMGRAALLCGGATLALPEGSRIRRNLT